MRHLILAALLAAAALLPAPAPAQDLTFPSSFREQKIATNGTTLHVRIGGAGPAVVLLHGYGETGDMWVPLAKDLARDHTVVVPDLRGMGLSDHPPGGYDKKTQGARHRRRARCAQDRSRGACHPRHRQHGRLRLRRAIPQPRLAFRPHRCAASWCRAVGGNPEEPAAVALPVRWSGHGAARRRARAHLSRPVLERVLRNARPFQRSGARALREALRPARRHALRLRAICRVRSGRDRQQGVPRSRKARRCRCSRSAARNRSA